MASRIASPPRVKSSRSTRSRPSTRSVRGHPGTLAQPTILGPAGSLWPTVNVVEQSPFVVATVSEWNDEKGWGVVFADEMLESIWVHFSSIETDGYKTLTVGQRVEVKVEGPLTYEQDGFSYRAKRLLVLLY